MGRVISVINQKGGVGKTTTAVNLAACLGEMGQKILLVDTDPQGNSTSGFGIEKRDLKATVYGLLINEEKASGAVIPTKFKNVSIIASGIDLAAAEIELVAMKDRNFKLRNAILPIKQDFDIIIVDCPPSLGIITLNVLAASDSVLIPIQCEFYALEGLSQLMATVRQVKRLYNPRIDLEGVLLTMYDGRLNLTIQVVEEVKKFFPKKVFKTVIPRNVRLSEAPGFGMPALYYDRASKGTAAYMDLAQELLES